MVGGAYILVVIGTLFAKAIGFFRDVIFASAFGTTTTADNYSQIFGLVTLVFTGIGVALSTLVIKNLNKEENSSEELKKAYVAGFLRKTFISLIAVAIVMYVFAGKLTQLVLPNVTGEAFQEALNLMYIMIPSMVFVIIAYIISGVLQNNRVFFITSIMSLPFNVLIISTLLVPNISIYWVGIATTLGWFSHILIQLPAFYKKGYSFTCSPKADIKKRKATSYEAIFIFVSNMMFQLCFITDKAFASGGDGGGTAALGYASNLFVTISSIFVVAMSTVIFPAISKNYEEGNINYVNRLIQYLFIVMMAIFVPFLLVVGCFGQPIISLVYERGAFDHQSTLLTAQIFIIYSLAIFGYIAQDLFNKVLYLASKYKYTLFGTVAVVGLNLVIDYFLVPQFGISVAAITTTVLLFAYAVMVAIVLSKVVGRYWNKDFFIKLGKITVSGVAAVLVYVAFSIVKPNFLTSKFLFLVPLLACGAVYLIALYATGLLKQLFQTMDKKEETEDAKEIEA